MNNPTFNKILTIMVAVDKLNLTDMPRRHEKVLYDMMTCHTEICGFTKEICENCGYTTIHYGSCNNSCCPQCGEKKRREWAEKQTEKLVNAPYFHIVFTVPDKHLNPLFLHDPEFMYNALFKASSKALYTLSAKDKYLGVVKPGFTSDYYSALYSSHVSDYIIKLNYLLI